MNVLIFQETQALTECAMVSSTFLKYYVKKKQFQEQNKCKFNFLYNYNRFTFGNVLQK